MSDRTIEALKSQISGILGGALSGVDEKYRTEDGYIRWGLVESDMHEAIKAWNIRREVE